LLVAHAQVSDAEQGTHQQVVGSLLAAHAQVIDTLLDEVVTAGVERSLDTALLEPLVLDRILASVQQQQQQQQ